MAADFRIRPLGDRVVVKPADREEKTKGGIYLPDTASQERPMEGSVLSVGEGRLDDNGRRVPMNVKAGDKVLFAKYSGTEYKVDDVEYLILSEKDILGIIQDEEQRTKGKEQNAKHKKEPFAMILCSLFAGHSHPEGTRCGHPVLCSD